MVHEKNEVFKIYVNQCLKVLSEKFQLVLKYTVNEPVITVDRMSLEDKAKLRARF